MKTEAATQSSGLREFRKTAELFALPIIAPIGIERIGNAIEIEYPLYFRRFFLRALQEGYSPIVASNHQGHPDALALANLSGDLTTWATEENPDNPFLKGFNLLIAKTISTGEQDVRLQLELQLTRSYLKKKHLDVVEIVRQKDTKLGHKRNSGEVLEMLRRGVMQGNGIMIFPEETVEGGRSGKDGIIHGLQPFVPKDLPGLIVLLKQLGKKPLIISFSIDGSYRIINPNTNSVTKEAYAAALNPFANAHLITTARVGTPIRHDEFERRITQRGEYPTKEVINREIQTQIALRLPEHARGAYGKTLVRENADSLFFPVYP